MQQLIEFHFCPLTVFFRLKRYICQGKYEKKPEVTNELKALSANVRVRYFRVKWICIV